tara:strand:- start:281 stop:394 length:114 start_codon:yes stop_codon:yes gene_type:complete
MIVSASIFAPAISTVLGKVGHVLPVEKNNAKGLLRKE